MRDYKSKILHNGSRKSRDQTDDPYKTIVAKFPKLKIFKKFTAMCCVLVTAAEL